MFPKINPTKTNAWKKLQDHFLTHSTVHMSELFEADEMRFEHFSVELEYFILLAKDLEYLEVDKFEELDLKINTLKRKMYSLSQKLTA